MTSPLNQPVNKATIATSLKAQSTSVKTLSQSASAMHVKQVVSKGLAAQQNSPECRMSQQNNLGKSPLAQQPGSISALDFHPSSNAATMSLTQSQSNVTPLKTSLAASSQQVSLKGNMFGKAQQQNISSTIITTSSGGYQPSYLRERLDKHSSYQSQSPMKHGQQRFNNQLSSSVNVKTPASKNSHHQQSSNNPKRTIDQNKKSIEQSKHMSRNEPMSAMKSVKNRSGSQFLSGKKFNPGHQASVSTTRAANTQFKAKESDQEYSQLSRKKSTAYPGMENSFTRLHKGNSSVVRTFERKLLQQSSSQIRRQQANEQANALRAQPQKNRNSNLPTPANSRSNASNHLLFNTRDKAANALSSCLGSGLHYQSNTSGSNVYQQPEIVALESDRTSDSVKCDTTRSLNGNNANGNSNNSRSKGQKQPRQSKSTTGPHGNLQSASQNNNGQSETQNTSSDEPNRPHNLTNMNNHEPEQSQSNNLGLLSPQITPTAAPRMATSQSMNHVLISSQLTSEAHNRPNASNQQNTKNPGSSSLSFTRRLIEETAARNERSQGSAVTMKNVSKERDISSVSVSIQSNIKAAAQANNEGGATGMVGNRLEISTSGKPVSNYAQKFISPKVSHLSGTRQQNFTSSSRLMSNQPNSLVSPMNAKAINNTISIDKKSTNTSQVRGTSNSGNKIAHNFIKASANAMQALNAAFSPDKRANISRSQQMQNNLYFKRGNKPSANVTTNDKSFSRENKHQRMFTSGISSSHLHGPTFNNNNITPGTSTSPSKAGPSYLKSTFSHASKAASKANVYNYQLNRVNAQKSSHNQTISASASTTQMPQSIHVASSLQSQTITNSGSLKEMQLVKVLDQGAPKNETLTQSHGPTTSKTTAGGQTSSQPPNSAGLSKTKAQKKKQATSMQMSFSHANNFNSSTNNQKVSATRGGIHRNKAIVTREKRPQSKRGMTVDKPAQNNTSTAAIRAYTKGQYINASANSASKVHQQIPSNSVLKQQQQVEPEMLQPQLVQRSVTAQSIMTHSNSNMKPNEIVNPSSSSNPAIDIKSQEDNKAVKLDSKEDDSAAAAALYKHSKSMVVGAGSGTGPQRTTIDLSSNVVPAKVTNKSNHSGAEGSQSKKTVENNYKRKQDQIIEMIQSNMKRSEDIQQSLSSGRFFSSVQKTSESRQSSASNRSAQPDISQPYSSIKEYQTNQQMMSNSASPAIVQANNTKQTTLNQKAEAPVATLDLQRDNQIELIASGTDSKMLFQKQEPLATNTLSPVGQETPLQVDDVFNDGQILHNKMVQDSSIVQQRQSLLPEISPEQQPDDGSSDSETLVVGEMNSPARVAPADMQSNPFESAETLKNEDDDLTHMKIDELEVVDEDLLEDRYSVISSAKQGMIQSARPQLPMKRSAFKAAYFEILTDQEKAELDSLELTNDMIYYANDIPTRAKKELAVTNTDDEDGYYVNKAKDQILYRFEVIKVLGKGSFAQVVSAIDHLSGLKVAVKINRNTEIDHKFAMQEGKLLKFLMDEDPTDEHNIVRMVEHIRFRDHQCFVFELLNTDLFEHLKENEFMGFHENQIRSYATQLLKALVFLEKRKVIHCDLKPENILCADPAREQLKVVDFGSGCLTHEQVYTYVQSRYYRAPEVILRIPYSEKVDIWSLGCILSELYTGEPLFPGNNEQEQLEFIMEMCGMFPEGMIDKSRKKDHYFDSDYSPFLIEDPKHGILRIPESRSIEEAIPSNNSLFLDFVQSCLTLDPETRPGAAQAMEHPWIRGNIYADDHVVGDSSGPPQGHDFSLSSHTTNNLQDGGYIPLRRPNQQYKTSELVSVNESLDLQNDMLDQLAEGSVVGAQNPESEEYYEGRITESDRLMTDNDLPVTQKFDLDQALSDQDTVKFGHSTVSQSRQREEAGARASAAEISPDRPLFLSDQQRITSFVAAQQSIQDTTQVMGRKTDAMPPTQGLNLVPISTNSSPDRKKNSLNKSPLKPSNESLLEHYKYEKQSKQTSSGIGVGVAQAQLQGLMALNSSAKKQMSSNSKSSANVVVEEPKILSLTSSFTQQEK